MIQVKIALQNLRASFTESPLVGLSLVTCLWLFFRTVIYHSRLVSGRPSLIELTMVALVGVGAAIGALLREREQGWYISLVTMALNGVAWWYALSQLDWGYLYES
jgi:hypothetical protein